MNWTDRFARRTRRMQPSAIREILKLTQRDDVISFAGGLPAPTLFPVTALREASERVLRERGAQALQYSTTEGHPPLREWIAAQLPGAAPERVQITSGSQQGLDLVARVLLDPGDRVAVAAPTYMGALRAFDGYEVDYLPVATDAEGMLPEALEAALQQRPKLLYAIPDFDNPGGTTLGLARRRALLDAAERHGVPVVEDAPYAELRFDGEPLPTLFELAPDRVIHLGTLSKTLVPGFRLAWVVAPAPLLDLVTRAKQAADLHTPTTTQMIAAELVAGANGDFLPGQIERVRAHYRGQRDEMLAALERHAAEALQWTRPQGGMFLWCRLPAGADAGALLPEAVARGVAYVPGQPFFTDGSGANTLRLSYSVATPEQIEQGMRRLGEVFAAATASV